MGHVSFKPTLSSEDLDFSILDSSLSCKKVENHRFYQKIQELTEKLLLREDSTLEEWWDSLYLPLREYGRRITVPFSIYRYQRTFFVNFSWGRSFSVLPGNEEINPYYFTLIEDTVKLLHEIKRKGKEALHVPYSLRAGKIEGYSVLEDRLSEQEEHKLKSDYENHFHRIAPSAEISLQNYLETAAICYQTIYGKETEGMTPRQMYQRWADGRHMGMLSLPRQSGREFQEWHHDDTNKGGHPFEIIFNKMHLYPPTKDTPFFQPVLGEFPRDVREYVRVLQALINHKIPFKVHDFSEKLDYLAGKIPFSVNEGDEPRVHYYSSQKEYRKYFHLIRWEPLTLPHFRT